MKVQNIIYFSILILLLSSVKLNAQSWQWSAHTGSNQLDLSSNVTVDGFGNSYWAGIFLGGYCYSSTDTLGPRLGLSDFYLSKYDGSGNKIWWKQIGGNNASNYSEGIASITSDNFGCVYITGSFSGITTFGSFTLQAIGQED